MVLLTCKSVAMLDLPSLSATEQYRERGWKYQQYIACLDPLEGGHQKTEYGITPEQYGRFLVRLFELWYGEWKKNRQPYIRQFHNYIAMLLGHQPEACDQRGICGVQYVVEADGGVYPCDFYMLDEYRLGNFNQNRLCELDEKRREIKFLERSSRLSLKCKSCPHYFLCRGDVSGSGIWRLIRIATQIICAKGINSFLKHAGIRWKRWQGM